MTFSSQYSPALLVVILSLFFAGDALAFGPGYVSPGSHLKTARFRHGDIALAVPLLATANRRIVKQIYFGNWLRDFSQLLDKGSVTIVPRPILRALVAVFAFLQFGYSTREFEVTDERLGVYRPEEHVDNPKGYDEDPSFVTPSDSSTASPQATSLESDARGGRILEGLRPVVHPTELAIDSKTGMKSYIGNAPAVGHINPTSVEYIEKQLVAAIACGRQGNEEAYVHLGAALHCLEDFFAHSNYVELALQMIGSESQDPKTPGVAAALRNVFAFVGSGAKTQTARGPAPPIVTGTFGALDLYQTLLGEIDDKLNAVSLPSLKTRMPDSDEGGTLQMVAKQLIGLLSGLTPRFEKDILRIQKSATERSQKPASWGEFDEQPEKLFECFQPVLMLRDDVVRFVNDHLKIRAVQDSLAAISTAIDKLVFLVLGTVLSPLLPELFRALKDHEQRLLREDQQARVAKGEPTVFDAGSMATDPTHSQLAKDHYENPLNELGGRVSVKVCSYTITEIVQLWQPGNTTDPRPSIVKILEAIHHPFNFNSTNCAPVQALMLEEIRSWVRSSTEADSQGFEETLKSLSFSAIASRIDINTGGHTHVDAPLRETSGSSDKLVSMRLRENIERQVGQGAVKNVSEDDLPGIREALFGSPSSESPNPVDAALTMLPGIAFLDAFDGIDVREIATYTGMGETLKDAVASLVLLDEKRAAHEEDVAAARDMEAKARLRELRPLLSFKDGSQAGYNENVDESKGAAAKGKLSAGIEKLKLRAGK